MKIKTACIVALLFLPSISFADSSPSLLAPGTRGEGVKDLQRFLSTYIDLYPQKIISGIYGPLTATAVKKFQKKYSIPPTGIVGPRTQAKITELKSAQESAAPITASHLPSTDTSSCAQNNTLTASPLDINNLAYIVPMGRMWGDHVTPTDHQYWVSPGMQSDANQFPVYAPAAGTITSIERMPQQGPMADDYRVLMNFDCNRGAIFIHLHSLAPKLQSALNHQDRAQTSISISSGELIAHSNGNFDFSVTDQAITLPGFMYPAHYQSESWKVHTVDPFDYFTEPLHTQLTQKSLRQSTPRGGKIDYDISGTLAGNWFITGTTYEGSSNTSSPSAAYFRGHLSFAYDHIDPQTMTISTGDYQGKSQQFVVMDNGPDPRDVNTHSGRIKYQLANLQYYHSATKQPWDGNSFASDIVARPGQQFYGTMLIQLIDDNNLRLEIFPNLSANHVNTFTAQAKTYQR